MIYDMIKSLIPYKSCQKYRCDSEFTLVNNYLNKMVYLNATASDVFLLCNGRNSIEEICKKMLCDYDVSYDIIKNDIVKIIRDLQWNNIIRLSRTKKVED